WGEAGVPGLGHPLEVNALRLGDPARPAAVPPVEELPSALGDVGLPFGDGDRGRVIGAGGGFGQGRDRGHRLRARLGRGGRRLREWIRLVDLEVGLDGRPELVAGPPEGAAELWQVLRPEDEERDHEDEDQLLQPDAEHGTPMIPPARGAGRRAQLVRVPGAWTATDLPSDGRAFREAEFSTRLSLRGRRRALIIRHSVAAEAHSQRSRRQNTMTRWTAIAVLAALVATAPLPGPAEAQTSDAVGVVTTLDGRATVARPALTVPLALKFKDDVFGRDRISTQENSLIRVLLGGKAILTVRELSEVTISEEP